jgi:nitronate monooxygenase
MASAERFALDELALPIVGAPLAGGPSTPALAAAVSEAGGLGFLAAGYQTADALAGDLRAARALSDRPFGVNLFAPPAPVGDPAAVERYAAQLASESQRHGASIAAPRHDDDGWDDKLALVMRERPAVVSVTFGCPSAEVVAALHDAGCALWVTVTTAAEALLAREAGADALVVQGVEAGGHRASFDDAAPGDIGLLALLALVRAAFDLPLVATGGIATGRSIAAARAAGAAAAQLGSALMLTPEAGTSPAHRAALREGRATALTRAFTGRTGRGIVNRFMVEHDAQAPSAYPDVHYLTAPLRAAARGRGDADSLNLWAGQAHALAREAPAAEIVRTLAADAFRALSVRAYPAQ